jgi:hypothetical protein
MKTRLSAEAAEEAASRKALAMSAEESRIEGTGRGKKPPSVIGPKG